jgi:hypothetical protein
MDRIIPGALDGTLTAQGVMDILKPAPVAVSVTPAASTAASVINKEAASSPDAVLNTLANRDASPKPVAATSAPKPEQPRAKPVITKSDDPFDVGLGSLRNEPRYQAGMDAASGMLKRLRPMTAKPISKKAYAIMGSLAALLAIVLWVTLGSSKPAPETTQAATTPTQAQPVAASPAPVTPSAAKPADTSLLTSTAQAGWRVIAYTYNHEQQAQAKAIQLQQKYVNLQPQVFSPTGHAPYFVALGGPLDSSSAYALRNRARQSGLPRDTYARNF